MSSIQIVHLITGSDHLKAGQKCVKKLNVQVLGVQYSDGHCRNVPFDNFHQQINNVLVICLCFRKKLKIRLTPDSKLANFFFK